MNSALPKVLVVDDDGAICNLVTRFLSQKNFDTMSASDGRSALEVFKAFAPDLVILDINLPDYPGYVVCEEMQKHSNVFVLMLTSRSDAVDIHQGFLKGADDYLTKPFDLVELEYRVRAILKRHRYNSKEKLIITYNNLTVNPVTREVLVDGEVVSLTALEFDILYFLATNPDKVWSRSELVKEVWEEKGVSDLRVVDVHVGQIRKKIETDPENPSIILTVRGVGYKFHPKS